MRSRQGPPRLHRALLEALLSRTLVGRTILGDLDEEYHERSARTEDPRGVDRWYRHQARRLLLRSLGDRLVTSSAWRARWRSGTPDAGRRGDSLLVELFTELKHAVRALVRSPGFSFVTVLTLGLGIGANTALFSVVRGVVLQPLPFEDPDELMAVRATAPALFGPSEFGSPFAFFQDYQEGVPLERAAAYISFGATFRVGDAAERVRGADVTADFFTTLGVAPVVGRFPTPEEVAASGNLAVIGHALWTEHFGADPGVIGRSAEIAERMRTIVAVVPPEVRFPEDGVAGGRGATMVWFPFVPARRSVTTGDWMWNVVVRLTPGVGAEELAGRLESVAALLPERYGSDDDRILREGQYRPVVRPLQEVVTRGLGGLLWTVLGATAFLLLIAAANVANLFMARAESRNSEMAVRAALGAGRTRLVRTHLSEAVVLALAGGALGATLAAIATPLFLAAVPGGLPRAYNVGMSGGVLAFTLALSLATALLFGLLAALRSLSTDVAGRLRQSSRGATGSRSRRRGRNALIVAQSALALVLLVGSGLMVRSFWILSSTDPGFETRDLLTFQVAPEPDRYPTSRAVAAFHQRFIDRIAALPGVQAVGAINNLPLDESPSVRSFVIDDGARAQEQATILAISNFASGGYFRTMGITLQEGRDFNGTDDVRDRGAVIVSRSLADRQWPGRSPLGERVRVDSAEEPWQTVVGVVEDVRPRDLRQPPEPMVYFPFVPPAGDDAWRISSPVYTVRTQDPEQLAGTIREELQAVEPSAPIYLVQTMEWLAARSMARLSFTMLALLVSAVMALLLGAVGLYGVLSYLVGLRTREIGIRLALGARPQDVRRMTLAEGARLTGIGLLLGAAGAAALTRLLAGLLYGIDPLDPYTFAAMTATLLFVGLLASWLPARRASAVDPMRSMRIE